MISPGTPADPPIDNRPLPPYHARMQVRPQKLSTVQAKDFTVAGYSVAGEESVVIVPELDVTFDIGRCPREALPVNNVLLTHGHTDHSVGLIYYFAQRDFQGMAPGRAVVPACLVDPLRSLLKTWGAVDGKEPPHELVGIAPGDDVQLRRHLVARSFPTRHSRGSLGYAIVEIRRKLKEEYLGLEGPAIVELKKRGVAIDRVAEVPLICYVGDTIPGNYATLPCVRDAHVLVIECTFFDPEHKGRASDGRHIHVDRIGEVLEGMNNEHILLAHVTRRTSIGEAEKILAGKLSADILEKTSFLMSRENIPNR